MAESDVDQRRRASRRGFLRGSALMGGGAVALAMGAPVLGFGSGAALAAPQTDTAGDIKILNYALTLEHLEYAFYRDGLKKYDVHDFLKAESIKHLGRRLKYSAYDYFKIILDHEKTHVDTLTSVIKSLGGKPVPECTYDFGYTKVDEFVVIAKALENTGVMAYDGAIALIQSPDLQTAGATIATVEARHASYLNLLTGDIPFPAAFDTPKTMEQILQIAGKFIVSCPA